MTNALVYISGPMTAKHGRSVEDNVAAGLRLFLACINAGIPAFCPQLTGAFPSAWTEVDDETWLAYDFAVIDRCTHMLMMPDWRSSSGAVRELEYALQKDMPVYHSLADLIGALADGDPKTWQIAEGDR